MQLKNFKCSSRQDFSDNEVVEEAIGKYKDKTEDELLAELVNVAKKAKENGTFDQNSIENFLQIVSPQLSEAQKEKMESLISVIKMQ